MNKIPHIERPNVEDYCHVAFPKPVKKVKSAKKTSERTVLNLWREIVLSQANHKCEYPNCTVNYTQLHPHHYFNKKNKSVKYDPLNGIALCHLHHTNGNNAAHLDPNWKEIWLASNKRPSWWLEELTIRKNLIVKDNDEYRRQWKNSLIFILTNTELKSK
jgi:hypothetical protein